MSAFVTDTHSLLWYLFDPSKLSADARAAFLAAEAAGAPVYVPSIVLVELRYLVEKGKFTEAQYKVVLQTLRDDTLLPQVASLDADVADALASIPRATVPDMPDRIIAATALKLKLPLVTKDDDIRKLTNVTTVW